MIFSKFDFSSKVPSYFILGTTALQHKFAQTRGNAGVTGLITTPVDNCSQLL